MQSNSTGDSPFSQKGVDSRSEDGVLFSLPYLKLPCNSKLKSRAKELRQSGNLAEVILWSFLKNKGFMGYDFTRQKVIGNFIVDFYCAKLHLIIEIDGVSHDYKGLYDQNRHEYLESLGLNIFRCRDIDVKKALPEMLQSLYNYAVFIIGSNQ